MSVRGTPAADLLAAVLDAVPELAPDQVPDRLAALASVAGLLDLVIYLTDLQETVLVPWPRSSRRSERIDGTMAGRAFQRGQPVAAGQDQWWIPLCDGGDRLGVLSLTCFGDDDSLLTLARRLAALIGPLITSVRQRSDSIARTRRRHELSLAAEARWSLLPPRSLSSPDVRISGQLEPAYEIAGDTFDYALDSQRLHLAVMDAMGHGLVASRLANLAVTSYRHSRRAGLELTATYREMDEAVLGEFGDGMFVTAHLAELDVSSGVLSVVNAGHPRPVLIRAGTAHSIDFEPATPVGLGLVPAEIGELRLQPGDSVLILSDGMTEARSAGGDLFGLDRVGDLAVRAIAGGESVPETVRRLIGSVLDHRGQALEDDATLLMLRWRP